MAASRERLHCRALNYLQGLQAGSPVPDIAGAFTAARTSAPLRSVVQKNDSLELLDEIAGALGDEGVDADLVGPVVLAVLTQPGIALDRPLPDSSGRVVHQACVARTGDVDLAVDVTVEVKKGRPLQWRLTGAEVVMVDLDEDRDRMELLARAEQLLTDYPLRTATHPPSAVAPWAWVGDPSFRGILGVPQDWEQRVKSVGLIHGVVPTIAPDKARLDMRQVQRRAETVFVMQGVAWAELVTKDTDAEATAHTIWVGGQGNQFADVLDDVRSTLLAQAVELAAPAPTARALGAGEVVYHRKIGSSAAFDKFDAGSPTPCQHGAGAFREFKKAPKAAKGMRRRYTNFSDSMLTHCSKFPNCNVYAVDQARG